MNVEELYQVRKRKMRKCFVEEQFFKLALHSRFFYELDRHDDISIGSKSPLSARSGSARKWIGVGDHLIMEKIVILWEDEEKIYCDSSN